MPAPGACCVVSLEQGSCTHSTPGAQVEEVGSFEAGLCCRKGVVLHASGFWGLPEGVALMSPLSPSAGCTNTLRCKLQTASEVLKKEKTEPNLVPLSLGCFGKGTRMKQG